MQMRSIKKSVTIFISHSYNCGCPGNYVDLMILFRSIPSSTPSSYTPASLFRMDVAVHCSILNLTSLSRINGHDGTEKCKTKDLLLVAHPVTLFGNRFNLHIQSSAHGHRKGSLKKKIGNNNMSLKGASGDSFSTQNNNNCKSHSGQ